MLLLLALLRHLHDAAYYFALPIDAADFSFFLLPPRTAFHYASDASISCISPPFAALRCCFSDTLRYMPFSIPFLLLMACRR